MDKARVLVLLLEGDSDRFTFETGFSFLLHSHDPRGHLQVLVFRGDVTINDALGEPIDSKDVIENIVDFINKELSDNRIKAEDLIGVIHIADLDAAFCRDEQVQFATDHRVCYDLVKRVFYTRDVAGTLERNRTKRDSLLQLMSLQSLELKANKSIPYRLFYVGINLEHAFYDRINCTSYEKEDLGYLFDGRNAKTKDDFVCFLLRLPYLGESYEESCQSARNPENAFLPISNLRYVIDFLETIFRKANNK